MSSPASPSAASDNKIGARDTRADCRMTRGRVCDASREAHRADRRGAGIRAFSRGARMRDFRPGGGGGEITESDSLRTNIDSKFVRA